MKNVQEINDEEGLPVQIPQMPRILVASSQGTLLSRGLKDCRKEFRHPAGIRISSIKLKPFAPSSFECSNLTVIPFKDDFGGFSMELEKKNPIEGARLFNNSQTQETSKNNLTSLFQNITVHPKELESKDSFKGPLFSINNGIKSQNEEKDPGQALFGNQFSVPELKIEGKGIISGPSKSLVGTNLTIDDKKNPKGTDQTNTTKPLGTVPAPLGYPSSSLNTGNNIPIGGLSVQDPKIVQAASIPSEAKESLQSKSAVEVFQLIKKDSELKKIGHSEIMFMKLESVFKAVDLSLGERPNKEDGIRGEISTSSLKQVFSSAVGAIDKDKQNLTKCRDELYRLIPISRDTIQLARLAIDINCKESDGVEIISAIEDLDSRNEVKAHSIKRVIKLLEESESTICNFVRSAKDQIVLQSYPDVSQSRRPAGPTASQPVPAPRQPGPGGIVDSKGSGGLFSQKSAFSVFGNSHRPALSKEVNWGVFKTQADMPSDHRTRPGHAVPGTMIDRVKRWDSKAAGQSPGLKLEDDSSKQPYAFLGSSGRPCLSSQKGENQLKAFLDSYFKQKHLQIDNLEKKLSTRTGTKCPTEGVNFNLSMMGDETDRSFSFTKSKSDRLAQHSNLFGPNRGYRKSLAEQETAFRSLVRKRVRAKLYFNESLKKQHQEEEDRELARQLKTIEESAGKQKVEINRQNTFSAPVSQPTAENPARVSMQPGKPPDIATQAGGPKIGIFEQAADGKPENGASKNQTQASLGGIFNAASKSGKPEGPTDKPEAQEKKPEVNATQGGLFGTASKPETSSSDTRLFPDAKQHVKKIDEVSESKPNQGLFSQEQKTGNGQMTIAPGSIGGKKADLFGTKPEDSSQSKSNLMLGSFIPQPREEEMRESGDSGDEEEKTSLGPSLKHTTSQIGESKQGSRQTNPLSKGGSTAEQGFLGKSAIGKTSDEGQKPPAMTTGLFGGPTKSPAAEGPKDKIDLFGSTKITGPDLFSSMVDGDKTPNIFTGQNLGKPSQEPGKPSGMTNPGFLASQGDQTTGKNGGEDKPKDSLTGNGPGFTKSEGGSLFQTGGVPATSLFATKPEVSPVDGSKPAGLFGQTANIPAKQESLFDTKSEPKTGGLFSSPTPGSFLSQPQPAFGNQSSLNLQGGAFATLLSGKSEKPPAPAFGQTTNLSSAGGMAMGSSAFGGNSSAIQPLNFSLGFNTGQPSATSGPSQTNIFMTNQQSQGSTGWMTGFGQLPTNPGPSSTSGSSAMNRMRG